MIRLIGVLLFLLIFFILSIPMFLVEYIIGLCNRQWRDKSSLRIVQWAFRMVSLISGVQAVILGTQRIPNEPVLFIGNHRSLYDIILTYPLCQGLTGYVAKLETKRVPILSTWMRFLYCLFLDRQNPKEGLKTIVQAITYIQQGISICIFPEGTRNKGAELSLLPFHEGSFKVATKTGCPIVPIAINNTNAIFEQQFPKIRKTTVVIEYGQPVYLDTLPEETKKHLGAYVQSIIQAMLEKNAAQIPANN